MALPLVVERLDTHSMSSTTWNGAMANSAPHPGGATGYLVGTSIAVIGLYIAFALPIILRLKSGEMRKVHAACYATIGTVSNPDHHLITIGKAGRVRWRGFRPTVRGTVMNPVDHPMGGGEGKGNMKVRIDHRMAQTPLDLVRVEVATVENAQNI